VYDCKASYLFPAVSVDANLRSKYCHHCSDNATGETTAVVYLEPNTQELNVTYMFTPIQEGDQLLLLTQWLHSLGGGLLKGTVAARRAANWIIKLS